jgi:hypothetical protein
MIALGKKWRLPSDRSWGGSFDSLALLCEVPRFHASGLSYYCTVNAHSKILKEIYAIGSSKYFRRQSRCIMITIIFIS